MSKNSEKPAPPTDADKMLGNIDKQEPSARDRKCYAYLRQANGGKADFHGNPWHPFLLLMNEYMQGMPAPDKKKGLTIMDGQQSHHLSFKDLEDISLARKNVTEVEIKTIAQWLGLNQHTERYDHFIELGQHFMADREEFKRLRGNVANTAPKSVSDAPAPFIARVSKAPRVRPSVAPTPKPRVEATKPPAKPYMDMAPPPAVQQILHAPSVSPAQLLAGYFAGARLNAQDVATHIEQKLAIPAGSALAQIQGTVPVIDEPVVIELLNILNLSSGDAFALMDANSAARSRPAHMR